MLTQGFGAYGLGYGSAKGGNRGGGCGAGRFHHQGGGSKSQRGGGCGCGGPLLQAGGKTRKRKHTGGYRATKKNLMYVKRWKQGKSIGFTMTSSLKAKGLIPRTSRTLKGKTVVSRKYR